ncbi:MAG: Nif3-like dinuclear metal center hexameric protein [Akkermansiaceae bacterium]|nr:Nif3-like dinuclear metal center hexameric protein [Akkermansiaceae bacterium]MCF7733901.1 Nif3-like dinuclear metal center hexameric protein [Akkermansiaceae bacterium]
MARLDDLVAFMDRELDLAAIPDYPGAVNGLQLANGGVVERIVTAVDASLGVVAAAAAGGPGLLLVHHGMFWQGAQPVRGAFYRKLKTAMDAGLAIYSAHLPLDVHPEWGNNICLARAIGMHTVEPFLDWKGAAMGLRGNWEGGREELRGRLASAVGGGPVLLCPGGPERIRTVGLVTGGAGTEVAQAAAAGVDVFISGEGPHWSFPLAEELGLNVMLAGHYATETFGVKALGAELARRFELPWAFVDRPTGL